MSAPVLFLIYNRPDTTLKVFEIIRRVKPASLFIAADGPKLDSDIELCKSTRSIIQQIDWTCDLKLLFREKNLGCREAISEAISWFFNQVEEGIILEDDCIPDESFFSYCTFLLERYRNDERITMISGSNHLFEKKYGNIDGYFYSNFCNIWGWASWRRVIKKVNWYPTKEALDFSEKEFIAYLNNRKRLAKGLKGLLGDVVANKFNTWDIVLFYNFFLFEGINIIPVKNLISNIGVSGTHAAGNTADKTLYRPIYEMNIAELRPVCELYNTEYILNEKMMDTIQNIISPKISLLQKFKAQLYRIYTLIK